MKKVLHRSFKPTKCKTSLQMAASRLKILKNKKDAHIKQLRRELAQLLASGQTQTAKIRVEHVVREEKTVAAYELVGIYCELLVARLGVIESQKSCPNDLKEPVASVLYASQRLSDVPELSDIVKHFSAKYGKDFASAAIGLQPNSGVSRLLVEKLSVKAPDGPTKIKILTEIAAEHNVTWEAETLTESDPKETTFLSGESSSQSASGVNIDSSKFPSNEPPKFQVPATANVQHGSSERNHIPQNSYPSHTHGTTSSDVNTGKTTTDHYHPDSRPSGARTDGREYRHPKPGNSDSSSWETEFADSTSAARAAAESAERASFAARAAAELSRKERMMMHDSTELQNSSSFENLRNNPPHRHSSSNMQSGGFVEEEMFRGSTRQDKSSRAEVSKNTVDEPSENGSWKRGHSRENSLETKPNDSFATIGVEKQPSMDDINVSCSEDVQFRKQSSRASSRSHSRNSSDDEVIASDYVDSSSILEENIFAREDKHQSESTYKDTDSLFHGPDVVAQTFDDYSSLYDRPQFDTEDVYHDEPQQGLGFSFLGSKTSEPTSTETNSWGYKEYKPPGKHSSVSQVFDEKPSSPVFDDLPASPPPPSYEPELSAKFDDYNPDSESEEEDQTNKGKVSGVLEEKPKLTTHQSPISEPPDDLGRYFFPSDTEDQGDDSRTREESDVETPTAGLNVEPLASEFKNEKTLSPYRMSPPRDNRSVKEHISTDVDPTRSSSSQTFSSRSVYTQKASKTDKRSNAIPPDSSSSDDDSEIEIPRKVSSRNQEKRIESRTRPLHRVSHGDSEEEIKTQASTRSQERSHKRPEVKTNPVSAAYLLSPSSDDEDEKEVRRDPAPINTKPTNTRLSRRTKGLEKSSSPLTAKTNKTSYDQESPPKLSPLVKPQVKQEPSASSSSYPKTVTSTAVPARTSKASYDQESPPKPSPLVKPLAKQEPSASSSSYPKTVTSSAVTAKTSKASYDQEQSPKLAPLVKPLVKQEATGFSSSLPKTLAPPEPETPAKERASHVHPKLPDYDDLFAKLGGNRR